MLTDQTSQTVKHWTEEKFNVQSGSAVVSFKEEPISY